MRTTLTPCTRVLKPLCKSSCCCTRQPHGQQHRRNKRPVSRSPPGVHGRHLSRSPLSDNIDKHTQVIAFACMASFLVSAAPLFAWWSRIRFSCPLDLVVRSFGLGIFAMVWVVYMLFRLCSTGPMGRLLYMTFGRLVGVVVRLSSLSKEP